MAKCSWQIHNCVLLIVLGIICQFLATDAKTSRVQVLKSPHYVAKVHKRVSVVTSPPPLKSVTKLHSKLVTGITNRNVESSQEQEDPLQSTFNAGFARFFKFLRNVFGTRSEGEGGTVNENEEPKIKLPGFPTTSIFKTFDLSSIIRLIQNFETANGDQLEILAEDAIVSTVSQLVGIIGFNDLRDWFGIIVMYFILGPILIPLFWLPISLFGMAGLLAPLFYFNPPSKLNTNVMGHDPLVPKEEAGGEGKSFMRNFFFTTAEVISKSVDEQNKKNSTASHATSTNTGFDECVERLSCKLTRIYRNNPVSEWLTSRLNATKVEWARNTSSAREDCSKYRCSLFPMVKSLMSTWNSANNGTNNSSSVNTE